MIPSSGLYWFENIMNKKVFFAIIFGFGAIQIVRLLPVKTVISAKEVARRNDD